VFLMLICITKILFSIILVYKRSLSLNDKGISDKIVVESKIILGFLFLFSFSIVLFMTDMVKYALCCQGLHCF